MRHYLFLLFILLLGTALFTAEAEGDTPASGVPVTVSRDSGDPGVFGPLGPALVPVELERLERSPTTVLAPEDHAADFCANATPLAMTDGTDGDASSVFGASTSPTDPPLTCMDGYPESIQGFRTVWYRFEAPASGRVVISTGFDPSEYRDSYDTVVALYHTDIHNDVSLACANLEMVACNDDSEGFLSEASAFVHQGEWYFIEVAAWHLSAEGFELRLAVVQEDVESLWDKWEPAGQPDDWLWEGARSRHMVVTDGTYIFVVSGETVVEDEPQRTPNVSRLTPSTGDWKTDLFPVPVPALPGLSRTTAAQIGGYIYIPAGFVGDTQTYFGEHWRYHIPINRWERVRSAPWGVVSGGEPYAWSQAVVPSANNGYYLTGGLLSGDPDPSFPSDAMPTGNLLFYSTLANTWNTALPDMDTPRYAHVAARLASPQGDKICVAGGIGKASVDEAELLNSAECYNPVDGAWSPIAPLNRARFSAGSAVGPDGRWYVFGGATVTGSGSNQRFAPETITEVYDPVANTWTMLDARYSLDEPGRAWPRGVFVDGTLWIFGGETVGTNPPAQVVPLIERLSALPARESNLWASQGLYLPVLSTAPANVGGVEPNDTFAGAIPIDLYQAVQGDFAAEDDFFDIYRFQTQTEGIHAAVLTSIPDGHNYDVYLYSANKYRVAYGENLGNKDELARTSVILVPGTYYAVVVRVFGDATADDYTLVVRPD